jgi:osmotically-inducible protein OsmY
MSNDENLKRAVLEELKWEPSVDPAHIGVTAADGIVTLSGHVQSFAEKHAAEAAVRRVKGVKAVAEEIEVRLAFESQREDDQIAAAAADRLTWDVSVPATVKVTVAKGWVTIDGQVEWYYQKEAANRAVRNLFGVIGVNDLVTIKPAVNTSACPAPVLVLRPGHRRQRRGRRRSPVGIGPLSPRPPGRRLDRLGGARRHLRREQYPRELT